jgi:hypothetical protein
LSAEAVAVHERDGLTLDEPLVVGGHVPPVVGPGDPLAPPRSGELFERHTGEIPYFLVGVRAESVGIEHPDEEREGVRQRADIGFGARRRLGPPRRGLLAEHGVIDPMFEARRRVDRHLHVGAVALPMPEAVAGDRGRVFQQLKLVEYPFMVFGMDELQE